MGSTEDLSGMARALLQHGVTSFLPTAWSEPVEMLIEFADRVREWTATAPADGATPLGFNLEGPFLSHPKKGAHNPEHLRVPREASEAQLERLVDGLRIITIAPEIEGAIELIEWMRERGVACSMGHSAATVEQARAGYAAGGRTTTHLFNGMSGVDHHAPGLAVAALTDDEAYVELIADRQHVHPSLWPIITRTKPDDRLLLISDAIWVAGTGVTHTVISGLEVAIDGDRCTLVSNGALAGSVIALDTAVRNLVHEGVPLHAAVRAASRNPAELLGLSDRGRIAPGQRADLVELDADLRVQRVMRGSDWLSPG
jgi:N-acetylglucosamine-6-phosphate deacetylase